MDIDRLTGEWLLKVIRDLAAVRKPHREVLQLHLFRPYDSTAAKIYALETLLHDLTWAELTRLRQALHIAITTTAEPETIEDVIMALRADMQMPYRSNALLAWSALYHRHFAPICLSSEQVAPHADISGRNYRRWTLEGAERLAIQLQRLELTARNDDPTRD